jgi:hypothetical protein
VLHFRRLHKSCTKILKLWEAPPRRLQSAPLSPAGARNGRMSASGRTTRHGPPSPGQQIRSDRSDDELSDAAQDLKSRPANPTQICGALALLGAAIVVTVLADFLSYRHAPGSRLRSFRRHWARPRKPEPADQV